MSTAIIGVPDEQSRKRKRTGKDRKQAKLEAEEAQARMEAIIAAARTETEGAAALAVTSTVTKARNQRDQDQPARPSQVKPEHGEAAVVKNDPESIAKRVPQGLKAIHPLLKQAKVAETQRLIKKIKWSRSKNDDVKELEAQVALLQTIRLHGLASAHLRTKLVKHHLFKHQPLPAPIESALSASDSNTTSVPALALTSTDATERAKAENRLVSNKVVADGVKDILAWVVGEEGAKLLHHGKRQSSRQAPGTTGIAVKGVKREVEADDEEGDEGHQEDVTVGGPTIRSSDNVGDESDLDDEAIAADAAGWESGSVDDIGDSYSEDGGGVSRSDISVEDSAVLAPPKRSKTTIPPIKSASTKSQTKVKTVKEPKPSKSSKPLARQDITSSLFLPSLAAGFTRGDSDDSDPDLDYDVDGAGVIGRKGAGGERKNRRGQRARQAIWEKKYGKNAKHVVREREQENAAQGQANIRNAYGKRAGPAAEKGEAKGDYTSRSTATAVHAGSNGGAASSGSGGQRNAAPVDPAPASKAAALHPSWEAARRKKLQLAAAPAAQKIVFD